MSEPERVLVVPTSVFHRLGAFQGFTADVGRYLPALLDPQFLRFMPRPLAEADPDFKQLIPYVVLRCAGRVFHYTRGKGGGEARLLALRSIGIGGHISESDGEPTADVYRAGTRREVEEEIYLESEYSERILGLINDDSSPVGQVHLGIVHLFELAEPRVRRREEVLADSGFAPVRELRGFSERFETWSRFLLDGGVV